MRSSLLTSAAAVLLVAIAGGLTGWFFFLRTHSEAIRAADSARGFSDTSIPGILGMGIAPTSGNAGVTPSGGIVASTSVASSTDTALASTTGADAKGAVPSTPQTPRLWHPAKTPIAGFGFVKAESGYVIRYAERATGYVYSADPWTGNIERLANTLTPKTQEAYFASSTVILRSFKDGALDTWRGEVGRTATSTALIGSSLGTGIGSLSIDTRTAQLFFVRTARGATEAVQTDGSGAKPAVLFSSPIGSWQALAVPGRRIVAQAPSDGVAGYAYELGKSGALTKLVGGIPGLTVLPRASSTAFLWSSARSGALSLFAQASFSAEPVAISLKTTTEKCVWGAGSGATAAFAYCAVPRVRAGGVSLDAWHQGALATEDAWWQIDTAAGATQALYASEDRPDVRSPQIDPEGRFIAYIDGRDSSLWVLRIVQ